MELYEKLLEYKKKGTPCMMVTVIEKAGEGPLSVGKKMLVTMDGQAYGTVGGGAVEYEARNHAMTLMKSGSNDLITYAFNEGKILEGATALPMACGGKATLFFEYEGAHTYLYIFGAGHVGKALAQVMAPMNCFITAIDHRADVLETFEGANVKYNMSFTEFIDTHGLKDNSYVVVCTPSHRYDYQVLDRVFALGLNPAYLGMLCSKTKLNDYLNKTYDKFGKDLNLDNFYAPIGLDTGGGSPAEIAVSIAAEILAIRYKKTGHKHMRGDMTHV